jgi:hypothetical protein
VSGAFRLIFEFSRTTTQPPAPIEFEHLIHNGRSNNLVISYPSYSTELPIRAFDVPPPVAARPRFRGRKLEKDLVTRELNGVTFRRIQYSAMGTKRKSARTLNKEEQESTSDPYLYAIRSKKSGAKYSVERIDTALPPWEELRCFKSTKCDGITFFLRDYIEVRVMRATKSDQARILEIRKCRTKKIAYTLLAIQWIYNTDLVQQHVPKEKEPGPMLSNHVDIIFITNVDKKIPAPKDVRVWDVFHRKIRTRRDRRVAWLFPESSIEHAKEPAENNNCQKGRRRRAVRRQPPPRRKPPRSKGDRRKLKKSLDRKALANDAFSPTTTELHAAPDDAPTVIDTGEEWTSSEEDWRSVEDIVDIERVESGQLIVEVLFSNGNKAKFDKEEVYDKAPIPMLKFYERYLKFN